MLEILTVVAGIAIIAFITVDALGTTLSVSQGPGPLTDHVARLGWRLMMRLHRPDSRSPLLRYTGPGLLIGTVLLWVVVLWGGWLLVFLGADTVVSSRTRLPGDFWDVAYYTGFTVFTLGVGDYVADSAGWRVVTAVASFSGLFLVTLAITYLVSVVSAVVARRAIAIQVNALGGDAARIVAHGWAGGAFSSAFVQHLVNLTAQLSTSAEQHLAYPVLNYFRSGIPGASAPLAVAELDEAMLLLATAVAPEVRPDRSAYEPVQKVLDRYLETSTSSFAGREGPSAPRLPDLAPMAEAGIPLLPLAEVTAAVEQQAPRRRRMRQYVTDNAWSWPRGD